MSQGSEPGRATEPEAAVAQRRQPGPAKVPLVLVGTAAWGWRLLVSAAALALEAHGGLPR